MIQTKTFSQRDPRWSKLKLGWSKTLTIGSDGCLITDIANMLIVYGYDENPATVNAKLKAGNGFSGALLIWSRVQNIWPKCKFVKLLNSYNNLEVSFYVYVKRVPVIVKVDRDPDPKRELGHWVLYVGDRMMVDPWEGVRKPTRTYPALKYSLYDRA